MGDQFRAAQAPSKVLHIRNLPFEATHEELLELTTPFGDLSKTKLNVGPNRNQAFVEFTDLSGAMQMINFFASNSDPAKVRGKSVYLQYSNRQEITNATISGEPPSNVLLVGLEGLSAESNVTIDIIHAVFSVFGFVCKLATFEKNGAFQTLVQYPDAECSKAARETLDGQKIPDYMLPPGVISPIFRIVYSAHTNLNVKIQSHRSRDYMDPYLPSSAALSEPLNIVSSGNTSLSDGNILLAVVENLAYPVTAPTLHSAFSLYGFVQKIAIFDKNGHTQALVQYADNASAAVAKEALEGHCMYEGGYHRLRITYSVHRELSVKGGNTDKSWDYTAPPEGQASEGAAGASTSAPSGGGADGAVTGADYEKAHEDLIRRAKEAAHAHHQQPPSHHPPADYPYPYQDGQHMQPHPPGPGMGRPSAPVHPPPQPPLGQHYHSGPPGPMPPPSYHMAPPMPPAPSQLPQYAQY